MIGATTVMGNVDVDHTTENTLAVLELCGYADVEVAKGAGRPLVRDHMAFPVVHGARGLGEAELPPASRRRPSGRRRLMVETARERPGEMLLVATGPLTNVALALAAGARASRAAHRVRDHGRRVRPSRQRHAGRRGEHLGRPRRGAGGVPRVRRGTRGQAPRLRGARRDRGREARARGARTGCARPRPSHRSPRSCRMPSRTTSSSTSGTARATARACTTRSRSAIAIDPSLVTLQTTRVEVETDGEWTRGADRDRPARDPPQPVAGRVGRRRTTRASPWPSTRTCS